MRTLLTAASLATTTLLFACSSGGGSPPPLPPAPASVPPPIFATPDATALVSAPSPFAADCAPGQAGTVYINAEVEPSLAVNPTNVANMIATYQQDRWSNGSARGLGTAVTFNSGTSWTRLAPPQLPPFSSCAGGNTANFGNYLRATDPWVTFGPSGVAYQMSLSTAGATNAMLVSRSADGGNTWGAISTLILDGAAGFNDKNAITADPNDANFVYAVWDRLAPAAAPTAGPTLFARTINGGASWEAARVIVDPGTNNQTIGNIVAVLPQAVGGAVLNVYTDITGNAATLRVVRSLDKGATWSAPIVIRPITARGAADPVTNLAIRDGAGLPSVAVAPGTGHVYVAWQDSMFSGGQLDAIALVRSTDGGATWSAPVRVNNNSGTAQAFTPTVSVNANGVIAVTYYDLRSDNLDPNTLGADYWIARSADGGATWTETRVTGPFDLAQAPIARGYFLGDYMALAPAGNEFAALYVQTTGDGASNRNDVYLKRFAASVTALTARPAMVMTAAPDPAQVRAGREAVLRALEARQPAWATARKAAAPLQP
jgi:hypothetical protein